MTQSVSLLAKHESEPSAERVAVTTSMSAQGCKVAYVMSRFPKLTETFVLFEMLAVEQQGAQVEIFPLLGGSSSGKEVAGAGLWKKLQDYVRAPSQPKVMHAEAAPFVARARYTPFFNLAIVLANLIMIARQPVRYVSTLAVIIRENRRNANFLWGGISIFPKCVYFARCMQRDGINHIHAHFANHPALAAYVIHRLTQIPYSFTAHGSDLHRHQDMLCQKVEEAAFVVAISSHNRDVITDHCGGQYADRVHRIHCGVDIDKFHPSATHVCQPGTLQVICIGTLHEVKGQAYLLRAVSRLHRQGVNSHVHLVGDGNDLEMLQELVREEAIESHVTFHGTKTRDQIIELLQSADLMVTPSVPTKDGRREGIPVVLMEGMACGLPVVASRLSGIPELVNSDEVGRLVSPKDVEGLAEAIRIFAEDDALRKRVGQQARQRVVDDFAIHRNAAKLVDLFQQSNVKNFD